jgi:hypothetical protein
MMPVECEFESEALAAAIQSRWPERVDAALRAHVASCAICADVIAVAGAIDEVREEAIARAAVPDSGRVWWRAQLRARREAAEAAGRPITIAQAIAFAAAVGLLGACFGACFGAVQTFLAMAAVLLLLPAAVYLALGRD